MRRLFLVSLLIFGLLPGLVFAEEPPEMAIGNEPFDLRITSRNRFPFRLGTDGLYIVKEGLSYPITSSDTLRDDSHNLLLVGHTEVGNVTLTIDASVPNRFVIRVLPQTDGVNAIGFRVALRSDEFVYGFGEPWNGSLNQRGKRIRMWVEEGTPDKCNFVPFYLSTGGYGLLCNTPNDGFFDVGLRDENLIHAEFAVSELEFAVFVEETFSEMLRHFCEMTGYPPRPPLWSFLPWKWRDEYKSQDAVYEDARKMRELDIPCGSILIDNPWQQYGRNSFEFDKKRFPDARKMVDDLHAMGYKVLVWSSPFTEKAVPNYKAGLDNNYYIRRGNGDLYDFSDASWIDFTNPNAVDWWKGEIKKIVDFGVDGFKLDRGQSIDVDTVYHDGSTGVRMHNDYARLFVKTYFDLMQSLKGSDFTLLPRGGCLGSHVYSMAKWPGDLSPDFNERSGLPAAVMNTISAGLSGFAYYGSDVGGFEAGGPSKNCFIRWYQFGAFSPIMEVGGKGTHEPWKFDEETVKICRYYATLRTELQPYFDHLAQQASETGAPLVRPLAWEFPKDQDACIQDYEYLLGRSFLVAPMVEDATARDIYLPEGNWVDYWTSDIINGPARLEGYPAPLDRLPLFIRAGAIIPMEVEKDLTGHGGVWSKGVLTLDIYPRESSSLRYSRSIGISPSEHYMVAVKGKKVTMRLPSGENTTLLRILCDPPKSVVKNGRNLAYSAVPLETGEGWYFDHKSNRCYVRVAGPAEATMTITMTD